MDARPAEKSVAPPRRLITNLDGRGCIHELDLHAVGRFELTHRTRRQRRLVAQQPESRRRAVSIRKFQA
jgi:hypothetical protein